MYLLCPTTQNTLNNYLLEYFEPAAFLRYGPRLSNAALVNAAKHHHGQQPHDDDSRLQYVRVHHCLHAALWKDRTNSNTWTRV